MRTWRVPKPELKSTSLRVERGGFDPEIATCWVDHATIGFGFHIYACFSRRHPAPVGLVWGICGADGPRVRFDVFGSFVQPWARRRGVRTLIQQELLKTYDVVATLGGSDSGGAAWMKAFGYRRDRQAMQWVYVRQRRVKGGKT